MSGSRLGRGRVGRLLLLGCITVIVVILMFVYKSTRAEMAKLKDLHVKCAQQQEALAAQLQVIYEYKVQLEKTLSNEKSANAAAKEELQQKASRERSLRDKDSLEATQRFNALQQNYKLLQTEHQDLKDDCKKKEDVALENAKRLEATLLELRQQQKKAAEERDQSMENLKNKYLLVLQEKEQLEERYNELSKATGENNGNVDHLQKQIVQLQRELDEAKKAGHYPAVSPKTENALLARLANEANLDNNNVNNDNNNNNKPAAPDNNSMQVVRPSSQHQVSSPSNEFQAGQNPQPLQAPQNHQQLDDDNNNNNYNNYNNNLDNGNNNAYNNINRNNNDKNDDTPPDEVKSEIRFENRDGNIVPVGPSDVKEPYALPLPYDHQEQQKRANNAQDEQLALLNEIVAEDAEPQKRVVALASDKPVAVREPLNALSSKAPVFRPQADEQNLPAGDPNDFD